MIELSTESVNYTTDRYGRSVKIWSPTGDADAWRIRVDNPESGTAQGNPDRVYTAAQIQERIVNEDEDTADDDDE